MKFAEAYARAREAECIFSLVIVDFSQHRRFLQLHYLRCCEVKASGSALSSSASESSIKASDVRTRSTCMPLRLAAQPRHQISDG